MKKSFLSKLIMILCIISMLSTLTACGKDENSSKETKKTDEKVEEEIKEEEVKEEVEEEVVDAKDVDTTEVEDVDSETEEADSFDEEVALVTGITSGNTYENYYFGLGITLDDEWTFDTQDKIEERRAQTIDMAGGGSDVQGAFDVTITDMIAVYSNGTDTVNIGIEKPTGTNYTEDDYITASIDPTCEMLGKMGMEDIEYDTGSYTIGGESHGAMKIHGTYEGRDVYEMLVVFKEGDYIAILTTCSWLEDTTEDIASNAYLL